jgi:hypothetical protein
MGLCLFKGVLAIDGNQDMKSCPLGDWSQAVCHGWVIIGKQQGLASGHKVYLYTDEWIPTFQKE